LFESRFVIKRIDRIHFYAHNLIRILYSNINVIFLQQLFPCRTDRTLTREQQPGPPPVPVAETTAASAKEKAENLQRTVTTLMGGRGYIQWRAAHVERSGAAIPEINNCDAYLVIWDHKL
jgi:hypothetical protein